MFEVLLRSGSSIRVDEADGYQPEGPMTTFFVSGSNRQTIDSWSTRIASYRTADIMAIRRTPRLVLDGPTARIAAGPEPRACQETAGWRRPVHAAS